MTKQDKNCEKDEFYLHVCTHTETYSQARVYATLSSQGHLMQQETE